MLLYKDYLTCKKSYQEAGTLLLLERKHACLFYKPGKGKTYPCIEAMRAIDSAMDGKANVLILSTADAIHNMWESDIVPQNILPKHTVLLSLSSAIVETRKEKLLKQHWDILVVDESHKIKSISTKSSKLVYRIAKKTKYAWGLTGTPRPNSDIDVFCQFHNLCVSDWGNVSYTNFRDTVCDLDVKYFRGNQVKIPIGISKKYQAGWERNVGMFTQRIDYDEVDDMPKLTVKQEVLPYVPTKEYLEAEDGVISLSDYETTMTKLVAIQKMHQAANGFLYITDEETGERSTYKFAHNDKIDWLAQNLTKEPTLIVYRFATDLEMISEFLDNSGISYTDNIDDFKAGNINILLLQCARCESFNLQMCNRAIFYTMDYSYVKYDQMLHRLWRIGQTKPVDIIILTFENTIEEKIWDVVRTKGMFADLFMKIKGA